MTSKTQPQGEPFTFTLSADDPFGIGSIFGSGNIFGESKPVSGAGTYTSTITPVTEPYPTELSGWGAAGDSYITADSLQGSISGLHMGEAVGFTFAASTHTYDPVQGMIARIEQLEREVAMFKAAGQELKQINDLLREAADQDRENRTANWGADQSDVDPSTAYDRAMKVVK